VLAGNSAHYYGGGTYYGTLNNCKLTGNSAYYYGGGAYYGTLNNCTLTGNSALFGGGVYEGIVTGSWVCGNSAGFGGGAMDGTLESSILSSNYASSYGGGAFEARLLNCTVVGNTGGAEAFAGGRVSNCIIYLNGRPDGIGSYDPGLEPGTINYCCITPLPLPLDGVGNITNAPDFMDASGGDLRLQPNSPCINAGRNTYVAATNDLDGNPRIAGRTVDIGAYEYQSPASALSYAWAQQYGLATDGSADYLDSDHDGMNNWQEWLAGTNPTNAASVLQLQQTTVLPAGMTLTWTSVTNRAYFVERSTNLVPPPAFSLLQTNIPGLPGRTTFTDTTPPASGPAFYRIGVQP
jgi:hypothetical protein